MYSWHFRLMEESKFSFGTVHSGRHEVKVRDNNGDEHRLSRFWANWDAPRPESFTIVRDSFQAHRVKTPTLLVTRNLSSSCCLEMMLP